jgi:hypothetical protein
MKIKLSVLVKYKADLIIISLKIKTLEKSVAFCATKQINILTRVV